MNLKKYLLNVLLDEKEIINELIQIDNNVQLTSLTYEKLINIIQNTDMEANKNLDLSYDYIVDGTIESIVNVLLNYSTGMNRIHINRKFVGISSWLVARINDFNNEREIDKKIILDINEDYRNFVDSEVLVICGFDNFIDGISELFEGKLIIKLEM